MNTIAEISFKHGDDVIKHVPSFSYLGSTINKERGALQNVVSRISKARYAFSLFQPVNGTHPNCQEKRNSVFLTARSSQSFSMRNVAYEHDDYNEATVVREPISKTDN